MVKLRLTRMGSKKAPFYRIVAIDSRKARDSQYIEQIGIYNPTVEPKMVLNQQKQLRVYLRNKELLNND